MDGKTITLFYGGDTNIGRGLNSSSKKIKPFVGITEMESADIRLVNLECVIATKGESRHKINTSYLRARPEQTNILVNADVDIVLTANSHTGDYGAEALLEQREYLDAAGILHTGSGKNFSEALQPVYKRVGDIVIAIFSVDSTRKSSAATADTAGTAYLSENNIELWRTIFADRIRAVHEKAHVVIVAPHWGVNGVKKPSEQMMQLGHLLIDLGADAVLGAHSHFFHGVENYKNRPIIYDAGDFLSDTKRSSAGCFTLDITPDGVEKVKFIPLIKSPGQTVKAQKSAPEIQNAFIALCDEFKTPTKISAGDVVEISFKPPRKSKPVTKFVEVKREKKLIELLAEPRPEWIVDKVPDDAIISPQRLGPLKLVGYHVPPECRTMTERTLLYVETYWTIDEPVDEDYRLSIKGAPMRECYMEPFGDETPHEFLDYMWPVNRWKTGVIYREKFGMSPPAIDKILNLNLCVTLRVFLEEKVVDEFKAPNSIKMRIPNLTYPYFYDKEFDDIIYQSEPGKCWNAEQLAKVTGGEWIVPPPKDWYTQALFFSSSKNISTPCLALLTRNSSTKFLENINKFDGAMLSHDVKDLPDDFPVLKVRNIRRAFWEIGVAARKRFQGKVIAVTGSAGKTTTCNMLKHFLSKEHKIQSTPGNENGYDNIPRAFANVKQDDAYVVLEVSLHAFARLPGSITYDFPPNVAVVTSLVPAHTGSGGSLERLAKYKSKIFCGMSPGSYAIINRDMPYYELFEAKAKSFKLNIITFGTHPDATIKMPVLVNDGEFFVADKAYKISCPVPAEQLYDALSVIGVSIAVGIPVEKTLEHLKTFTPVKGRGNIVKSVHDGKNLTIINSAFNANPISMRYALEHLKNIEPNQKSRVAILGDIADLDSHSVELHRQLAESMLAAEPDRLLLCGKLMRHPYEVVKGKLNVLWFETLKELLANVENHLRDGDTILVKSSHATGLSEIVDLLSKDTPSESVQTPPQIQSPPPILNVPTPLFDVKDFLPEEIALEMNGKMPADKLQRIHCGGQLYLDAARSWLAMVRAAAQDKVFLNVNSAFNAYRKLESQIRVFNRRFVRVDTQDNLSADSIRVEFEGKVWQLKPDVAYAAIPGTSSHGYGLAVDIVNSGNKNVRNWLAKNAASFGFVKEYDFEPWHFTYVKSREEIPARVLEIENLPPEPIYTAEQIQKMSGCRWYIPPNENWICNGIFYSRPVRPGYVAVVDQGDGVGISEQSVSKTFRQLAGLICVDPEPLMKFNRPILVTSNLKETIKKISTLN